eukprot:gb/GECH01001298.1/.p1 GENE.gb/GECH01001298.1/~~gb/GECH01001298.1/.p1  ORF type:complete len:242 (+),score=63.14 gb/GECH01001298.1/:1-726(+)
MKILIFDCDGVLVNSEPLSCKSLNVLFEKRFGVDIGTNYDSVLGKSAPDAARILCRDNNISNVSDDIINELAVAKEDVYFDIAKDKLQPFEGIYNLIHRAKESDWCLGVGSSGSPEKIRFNLEQVKLFHEFPIIVSAKQVLRGKPHPDLFLEAQRQIKQYYSNTENNNNENNSSNNGNDSSVVIVIEDSTAGIKSAVAANAIAIGITTSFSRDQLLAVGAHVVVDHFEEIDLDQIYRKYSS